MTDENNTSGRRFEGNRLADRADDLFGFRAVAELVAGAVVDRTSRDCMVVGIEGEWGSGKSMLLSILEGDLQARGASAVRFAPWLIGARDALLRELIAVLEKALADQLLNEGDATQSTVVAAKTGLARFRRYSTGVAALGRLASGAGAMGLLGGAVAGDLLDKLAKTMKDGVEDATLEDAKKQCADALQGLTSRIVVLIDDMDRLEPVEAVEVLRLVQAVADFPNVTYVLSYDRQRLSESVKAVIKVGDGSAYLEKLIQLVVPLPQPHPAALVDMFTRRLKAVAGIGDFDDQLAETVVRHVGPRIRTPRGVVRVLDSISLLWPVLKGRVNIGDLVWLQFVRNEDESLYRWIEGYVAEASRAGDDQQRTDARKRLAEDLQDRLAKAKSPLPDWNELRSFLPMVGVRAGKPFEVLLTPGGGQDVFAALQGKRLSSIEHARIYFGLLPPEGLTAQGEYEALILASGDGAEVAAKLVSLAKLPSNDGPALVELVLGLLELSLPQLEQVNLSGLSKGIISTVDEIVRTAPVADRKVFGRSLSNLIDRIRELQTVEDWSSMLDATLQGMVAVDFLTRELPNEMDGASSAWVRSEQFSARLHRHIADAYAGFSDARLVSWSSQSRVLDAWKIACEKDRSAFLKRVLARDDLFTNMVLAHHERFVLRPDEGMRVFGEHVFYRDMDEFWGATIVLDRLEQLLANDTEESSGIEAAMATMRKLRDEAGQTTTSARVDPAATAS